MTQKLTIAEYRKETGSGDQIKETPLSGQIAKLMTSMRLENDRIQSGRLYVGTEYITKKGVKKQYGRWIWMAKTGTPDRWCLIHGKLVFVEVKTKGKQATPEQLQRQKELIAAGAICITVDSLEDAHRHLAGLKRDLCPQTKIDLKKQDLLELFCDVKENKISAHFFVEKIGKIINGD